MKKILILNGSPRKNGATAKLKDAFIEGAKTNNNEIKEHYITGMKINYCIGCDSCLRTHEGCIQKDDDMSIIYDDLNWADVIVFVSPQFWGTITAQLKVVLDRMFAWLNIEPKKKEMVYIMTARGNEYTMALDTYNIFIKYLDWKNLGTILGSDKLDEARIIGASIK